MNGLILLCTCFAIGFGLRQTKFDRRTSFDTSNGCSERDNHDKAITPNWFASPSNGNYNDVDNDDDDVLDDDRNADVPNEAVATNSDSLTPSNNAKRGSINWIKHHPVSFIGMLDKLHTITGNGDTLETLSDAMVKREATLANSANPSLYPGVVAKSIDINGFQPNNGINQHTISNPYGAAPAVAPVSQPTYNRIWDQLNNLHVNGADEQGLVKKRTNEYLCSTSNNGSGYGGGRVNSNNSTIRNDNNDGAQCPKFLDPQNTTDVLERVLQELDVIKTTKVGDDLPDGAACDITGVWNSEIVRMGFNISIDHGINKTMTSLRVALFEHMPPRTDALMNTNWTCHGEALHNRGGPFFIIARKPHSTTLANFDGICQICGGIPTIFGVWNFVHQPKDCRDLQMFVETKRDIFRKDVMHDSVLAKPRPNDTKPDAEFRPAT